MKASARRWRSLRARRIGIGIADIDQSRARCRAHGAVAENDARGGALALGALRRLAVGSALASAEQAFNSTQ